MNKPRTGKNKEKELRKNTIIHPSMLKTVEKCEKRYWKTNNKLLEKNVFSTWKKRITIYTTPEIKTPNWKPCFLQIIIRAFLTEKMALKMPYLSILIIINK